MFFGIVIFAVIYVLFVCGQVILDHTTINNTSSVATAYDELNCMHDSVYEILLELQYHLSEMHKQINEQMLNIHACGISPHEEGAEEEEQGAEEEEEDQGEPSSPVSEWDYEFPAGKIVPPPTTNE